MLRKCSSRPRDSRVAMLLSVSCRSMMAAGLLAPCVACYRTLLRVFCWIHEADPSAVVRALLDESSVMARFGLALTKRSYIMYRPPNELVTSAVLYTAIKPSSLELTTEISAKNLIRKKRGSLK
ncbi:uncharacterized protein LOC144103493 [Amblyomma americanum]